VRGAAALVLALVAWVGVYGVGLESTWVGVAALAATIAALAVGIFAARRAEPLSADALLGVAGAALAGLLLLVALLVVLFSVLGWAEWR
jgi:hypothetical protein